MEKWKIKAHRDVMKKDIPLLKQHNLKNDFDEIAKILKDNPYSHVRNFEKLEPRKRKICSMRINNQHRVVYTVDKKDHQVIIWSAWSHYERKRI